MKLIVTFKQINPDFDQKYADEYNAGKESNNNMKYHWSRGFELSADIEKVITRVGAFVIDNLLINEEKVEIRLPNMKVLECISNNEVISSFAVSKKLLKKTQKTYNEKYDIMRFYFYINPREDYVQLGDKIYLLESEIPNELLKIK
mgnify:CR=1 FL=1